MTIPDKPTAQDVYSWISYQIDERLTSKYRWSRNKWAPKKAVKRSLKLVGHRLFGSSYAPRDDAGLPVYLGVDEFGRDVSTGLRLYLDMLRSRSIPVRSLMVLGSRAKGTWHPKSDVDLLIVCGNSQDKRRLCDHPLYMGVESTLCSDSEFMRWLNECRIIALDAMYYGVIVFDDGFWAQARQTFSLIERKYELAWDQIKEKLAPL